MRSRLALHAGVVGLLLMPGAALAHTGIGETSGFAHGFSHPVSGVDHVLAMFLVGLLAWQLGGRALWLVPLAFVSVMAAGGALAMAGVGLPLVETGIALSVLVLGLAIALRVTVPAAAAAAVVGGFALFHGHAHGAEMPGNAAGLSYAAGFLLATALLHAGGIGVGFGLGRAGARTGQALLRGAGAMAVLAGLGLLTGAV